MALRRLGPPRRGWVVIAGVALAVLTLGALAQYWLHQGWFLIVWLVGGVACLRVMARGLNVQRAGLGTMVVAGVLAIPILLLIAAPFVTSVVLESLLERQDLIRETPPLLPPSPTFEWYGELLRSPTFAASLRNSLVVASLAALLTTILGLLGAYAIARLRFPARAGVYNAVMLSYMLPAIALIVPLVFIFRWWGTTMPFPLIDTWYGMVVGHMALLLPFIIWMLVGTYEAIEPDIEHAARVDGATRLRALLSVTLPMTAPSVATVLVFSFILSWNEFLLSKVLYVSRTPMLGPEIVTLMDPINRFEPRLAAAGVLASAPVLILAVLMQRFIVKEIATGAVK